MLGARGGSPAPASRSADPRSARNGSTPRCSISASVARSTPAEPRFRLTRRHASWRLSALQIRSNRAWKRRPGGRLAAIQSWRCRWRTLSRGFHPSGTLDPVVPVMPSYLPASPTCPSQGRFPPVALVVTTSRGTTTPSDARCAARVFTIGHTRASAPTRAAQTGLSCSVPLRVRERRPVPRRDRPHVRPRTGVQTTWPSPRHDRLGSRIVNLSRRQASRDAAARVLAPSVEALDAPLGPRGPRRHDAPRKPDST